MDKPLSRFLLFAGQAYYPSGGWDDFAGSFLTLDEARSAARKMKRTSYQGDWWWHIVDLATSSVVESGQD